jgi:cytochrome c-type biogenesis protein
MKVERAGFLGAFLLGLIFGIGLGPCTFAFLAPVLATVYQIADDSMIKAIMMIGAFGVGHTAVIVVGGSMSSVIIRFMRWSENNKTPLYIKRVLGLMIVMGGLYFIYNHYA